MVPGIEHCRAGWHGVWVSQHLTWLNKPLALPHTGMIWISLLNSFAFTEPFCHWFPEFRPVVHYWCLVTRRGLLLRVFYLKNITIFDLLIYLFYFLPRCGPSRRSASTAWEAAFEHCFGGEIVVGMVACCGWGGWERMIWLVVDCGCSHGPGGGWGSVEPPGLPLKNGPKIVSSLVVEAEGAARQMAWCLVDVLEKVLNHAKTGRS